MDMKYEKNPKMKETLKQKCSSYFDRAEELKKSLAAPVAPEKKASAATDGGKHEEDEDDESKKLKAALASAIVIEKPNVKWTDVAGLDIAKEQLQEAVILPLRFPKVIHVVLFLPEYSMFIIALCVQLYPYLHHGFMNSNVINTISATVLSPI